MICDVQYESRIRIFPPSRIQKGTGSLIRTRNTAFKLKESIPTKVTYLLVHSTMIPSISSVKKRDQISTAVEASSASRDNFWPEVIQ
jgi:hypothetical protein